jgi:hypothetical protein
MLNNITWSSFLWMIIPLAIFYYLLVFFLYFRKDFYLLLTGSPSFKHESQTGFRTGSSEQSNAVTSSIDNSRDLANSEVYELINDLKGTLSKASRTKMVKEEVVQAIRSNVKRYPFIGQTGLLEDINLHITQEAKESCRLELLPEDLKLIWSS